ncbi:MAG: hypothetical protein WA681_06475 [Candidatus Acidiferrales bacterium]
MSVAWPKPTVIPGISYLHAGEREVITLALERPESLILMDDRRGSVEAKRRGLEVIGTLAVLDTAAGRGWIDLAEMFARLRVSSFRSPLGLMARMLEQDARREK